MPGSLAAAVLGVALLQAAAPAAAQASGPTPPALQTVATFDDVRPGNPAVAPGGRTFLTMSALSEPDVNVVEVLAGGGTRPFPNPGWAGQPGPRSVRGIAATIGIRTGPDGTVWVLDMGDREADPTQPPKLVAWHADGTLARVVFFPEPVLREHSFLQDFAVDPRRGRVYVADMTFDPEAGASDYPAFLVVDLETGMVRRVLERHPSTMPSGEPVVVDGRAVGHLDPAGQPVPHLYGLNPVAIDPQGEWVYFGAMGGKAVHRVPAAALADPDLPPGRLAALVEQYAEKPHSDGIAVDGAGNVYVTDVERHAVGVARPEGYRTLVRDGERLAWPDGLSLADDGWLYVTANQLHNLPALNYGVDASRPPFYLHRLRISSTPAGGPADDAP